MDLCVELNLRILFSKSFISLCANLTSFDPAAFTPTNKELWINLSAITILFLLAKPCTAAILAWNPLGNKRTFSLLSHSSSCVSNDLCIGLDPVINLELPEPSPSDKLIS